MKIENNAYAEFQGANKLHFGGGGGEFKSGVWGKPTKKTTATGGREVLK